MSWPFRSNPLTKEKKNLSRIETNEKKLVKLFSLEESWIKRSFHSKAKLTKKIIFGMLLFVQILLSQKAFADSNKVVAKLKEYELWVKSNQDALRNDTITYSLRKKGRQLFHDIFLDLEVEIANDIKNHEFRKANSNLKILDKAIFSEFDRISDGHELRYQLKNRVELLQHELRGEIIDFHNGEGVFIFEKYVTFKIITRLKTGNPYKELDPVCKELLFKKNIPILNKLSPQEKKELDLFLQIAKYEILENGLYKIIFITDIIRTKNDQYFNLVPEIRQGNLSKTTL